MSTHWPSVGSVPFLDISFQTTTVVKMMSTIDETEEPFSELNQEGDNLFYELRFLVQPVSLLGRGAGEEKQANIKNFTCELCWWNNYCQLSL